MNTPAQESAPVTTSALTNPPAPQTTSPSADKISKSRRKHFILIGILLLLIAAFAGWKYWTVWRFDITTNDAYVHVDYVVVAPQVAGVVTEVFVGDNQPVKKGDRLAVIDPTPYQAAVDQIKANIEHSEALIAQFKSTLGIQPQIIQEVKADIAATEADLKFAKENYQRYVELTKTAVTSIQTGEEAVMKYSELLATLQKLKSELLAAEKDTQTIEAQLAAAKAMLKQNQAVLIKANYDLRCTELLAPMDGIVGNRALREGMYVQPGSNILSVVPLHAAYVRANYEETKLGGITPGQPVTIKVDAYPGKIIRGVVNSLAPAAGQTFALLPPDNATGNFIKIVQRVPVKILLDPSNPLAGYMRPGMSVHTTVHTKADKLDPQTFEQVTAKGTSKVVPAEASANVNISETPGGEFTPVKDTDGTLLPSIEEVSEDGGATTPNTENPQD